MGQRSSLGLDFAQYSHGRGTNRIMTQPPTRPTWPPYNQTDTSYFQQQMYNLPFHPARCTELCCQTIRCPEPLRAYQPSPYVQPIPVPQQVQEQETQHSVPIAPYWPRHSHHPTSYHHAGFQHKLFQPGYNTNNYYNLRYRFHPYNNAYPQNHGSSPSPRPQGNRMLMKKPPELDVRQFLATWQDKDEETCEDNNTPQETVVRPLVTRDTFQPLDCTMRNDTALQLENPRDLLGQASLGHFDNNKSYLPQNKPIFNHNSLFPPNISCKEVGNKDESRQRTSLSTPVDRNEYFGNLPVPGHQFDNKALRYPHSGWQIAMPCERRIDKISNPNVNSDQRSLEMMHLESFNNRRECAGEGTNFTEITNSIQVNYEGYKQVNEKYNLTTCLETDELFDDINKRKEERQKLIVHPLRHDCNFNHNSNSEVSKNSDMPQVFVKPTVHNGTSREQSSSHDSVIVHANSTELSHWDEAHVNMQQRNYTSDVGNIKHLDRTKNSLNLSGDKILPYNYNQDLQSLNHSDSKNVTRTLEKQLNLNESQTKTCASADRAKIEFNFKSTTSTICTVVANQIKPVGVIQDGSHAQENDNCFFDSCNLSRDSGDTSNKHIGVGSPNNSIPSQNQMSTETCLSSEDIDITISSSGDLDLMANSHDQELNTSHIKQNKEISDDILDETRSASENLTHNFDSCLFSSNLNTLNQNNKEIASPIKVLEESKDQTKPLSAHVHPRILITKVQTECYITTEVDANPLAEIKNCNTDESIENILSSKASGERDSVKNDVSEYIKSSKCVQNQSIMVTEPDDNNLTDSLSEFDSVNDLSSSYSFKQSDSKVVAEGDNGFHSEGLPSGILNMSDSIKNMGNSPNSEDTVNVNSEVPKDHLFNKEDFASSLKCDEKESSKSLEEITEVGSFIESLDHEEDNMTENSTEKSTTHENISNDDPSQLCVKKVPYSTTESKSSFAEHELNDRTSKCITSSQKENALLSIAYLYEDANISNSSDECYTHQRNADIAESEGSCILEYENLKCEMNDSNYSQEEITSEEEESDSEVFKTELENETSLNKEIQKHQSGIDKHKHLTDNENYLNNENSIFKYVMEEMSCTEEQNNSKIKNKECNISLLGELDVQEGVEGFCENHALKTKEHTKNENHLSFNECESKIIYNHHPSLYPKNTYFVKNLSNTHHIVKKPKHVNGKKDNLKKRLQQTENRGFISKLSFKLFHKVKNIHINYRVCKQILSKYRRLKKRKDKCKNYGEESVINLNTLPQASGNNSFPNFPKRKTIRNNNLISLNRTSPSSEKSIIPASEIQCNGSSGSQVWAVNCFTENSINREDRSNVIPSSKDIDKNCGDILNSVKYDQENDINDNILLENSDWSCREGEGREGQKDINLKCSLRWDRIFNVKDRRHIGESSEGSELNLGPAKVGVCLVDNRMPGQWRVVGRSRDRDTGPQVVKVVKRLIMQPKTATFSEERVPKVVIKKTGGERYESYLKEELQPTVMLERRSEIDSLAKECDLTDRMKCHSCSALFSQEEFLRHSCTPKKEAHHCCLCQQTFSSLLCLQLHQDTRSHHHLEMVQRNAAHNVHKQLTGQEYPLFAPLTPEDMQFLNWKPDYPGYTHYYHNAPL